MPRDDGIGLFVRIGGGQGQGQGQGSSFEWRNGLTGRVADCPVTSPLHRPFSLTKRQVVVPGSGVEAFVRPLL